MQSQLEAAAKEPDDIRESIAQKFESLSEMFVSLGSDVNTLKSQKNREFKIRSLEI